MKIQLKKANAKDLNEILLLFKETIISTCNEDYNSEQIRVWTSSIEKKDRWKSALKEQLFIIALFKEKIVGFGSLENGDYIDYLYVHKDYLRKGIANKIFEKLEFESKKLGFEKLSSDVSKTARPFFESKGFEVYKENKNIINGIEIINYKMIK